MRKRETEARTGYQDRVSDEIHEACPQDHIYGSEGTSKQVEELAGVLMITNSQCALIGHLLCS